MKVVIELELTETERAVIGYMRADMANRPATPADVRAWVGRALRTDLDELIDQAAGLGFPPAVKARAQAPDKHHA